MNNLSLEEVEEVVRLAIKRRASVYGAGASADRLADVLGLPAGQVQGYVREIRDGQAGFGNRAEFRRAMIGVGLAAAVLILFVIGNFVVSAVSHPAVASAGAPPLISPSVPATVSAPVGAPLRVIGTPPTVAQASGEPLRSGFSDGHLRLPREETASDTASQDHTVKEARRDQDVVMSAN